MEAGSRALNAAGQAAKGAYYGAKGEGADCEGGKPCVNHESSDALPAPQLGSAPRQCTRANAPVFVLLQMKNWCACPWGQ
jgi:hypothetical protein